MRYDWRGSVIESLLEERFHPIGCKHLRRAVQRRLGESMGIHPYVERPADSLGFSKLNDRLARSQDMRLIKAAFQG